MTWAEGVRAAARAGDGQAEGRLLHLGHAPIERVARVLSLFPSHYHQPSAEHGTASRDATERPPPMPPQPLATLLIRTFPHRLMGLEPSELAGLAAAYHAAGLALPGPLDPSASAPRVSDASSPASLATLTPPPIEPVVVRSMLEATAEEAAPLAVSAGRMGWHRDGVASARVGSNVVPLVVGALFPTASSTASSTAFSTASSTISSTASSSTAADSGASQVTALPWWRTDALDDALRFMAEDHAAGSHLCLVGPAGAGKLATRTNGFT